MFLDPTPTPFIFTDAVSKGNEGLLWFVSLVFSEWGVIFLLVAGILIFRKQILEVIKFLLAARRDDI